MSAETSIPSPIVLPDLNDVTTGWSKVRETLSRVKSVPSHAYDVLYEHFIQHDIKLHPLDKISLNSPQLSVSSASLKSPLDKVALVQHDSHTCNLCPTLYTGKKEKLPSHLGDKALSDENTCQPMTSPLIPQGSIDQNSNHAQLLVSSSHTYRLLSSKGLSLPVSHDENGPNPQ